MGLFRKNKEEPSKLFNEIGILNAKIVRLEAEIDRLLQLFKGLNGRVNRKLGNESETSQIETNKYSDPFDSLRKNGIV